MKNPKNIAIDTVKLKMAHDKRQPGKRLFIGLVAGTSFILCLTLLVGWVIPYIGFGNIHPSIPYITGGLLVLAVVAIAWSTLCLVLHILLNKKLWGADKVRGLTIRYYLPIMELLGKCLGFTTDEVRRSFIKVNNQLTVGYVKGLSPQKILILLPHCLQQTTCPMRLSYVIDTCKRCGQCPIDGILSLRDKYGVHVAVATGGTIARKIVVELKPSLILAVACERDLTSGIHDTFPLPVFGILNERPEGPCKNTLVSINSMEKILQSFLSLEHDF